MSYLGSTKIGKMYLGSTEIAKAYLGTDLVFQNGGSPTPPLPYTPVDYIVTDGACSINVGSYGTPPRSCEIKVMMGANTTSSLLAAYVASSGTNSKAFALARYNSNKCATFSYYSNYGLSDGMPSVQYSIDNNLPFIIKTDIKKGTQHISVKQENSDSWTTVTKSNNNTVSSTTNLRLFSALYAGTNGNFAPSGTRLYYCKVYDDDSYTHLIFDGVPCLYNGAYGLWDNVANIFKGNYESGTLSGPSNL